MPDVREVYEMVTKQKQVGSGALERQHTRQVRTTRNRKLGTFALVAVLAVVGIILAVNTLGDPGRGNRTAGEAPQLVISGVGHGFSQDGTSVFVAEDSPIGRIYDASTGTLMKTVTGSGQNLNGFSPDGSLFFTVQGGNASEIYTDVYVSKSGERLHRFRGACCFGAFSPDNRFIALPSHGETRVFELATGMRVSRGAAPLGELAFSPDGERLLVAPCCGGEQVGVTAYVGFVGEQGWGDFVTLEGPSTGASPAWSPDGSVVATISSGGLELWDPMTGERLLTTRGSAGNGSMSSVVFGTNGTLATISTTGRATVWDFSDGQLRPLITVDHGASASYLEVFVDPSGTRLMTTDGLEAKVWDVGP